ncbi:thermonuclease family protein [Pantoea sp. 18069]|uniref:thermonuclease family protein n=1 Tax=Pantoea sp. 18069 TaxID=2681415 RepID=UPI00135CDCF9|nr:thermonuclease family protein [Pantoea sp. 18069]
MIAAVLVCLVVGISDGDTLTVRCGQPARFEQRQVRIHAIDAPERHQSFSEASRASLARLCLNIRARIRHVDTDGYGRTIAQVECRGEDVAEHQVRCGMAWVYTRYAGTRTDLLALQARARSARSGLWADAHPIPPWVWRRR